MDTFVEKMQAIVTDYIESGEPWPASTHQMASWAIQSQRWAPQRSSLVDICADQLARAMRDEYITDPQGRRIRAKHAARVKRHGDQITIWDDIRTATREHMEAALKQRRKQIVGDCRQLKTDADSFNENRSAENPIQVVFDFTQDLAEFDALTARSVSHPPRPSSHRLRGSAATLNQTSRAH
jgi:hypothetical protein